MLALCAQLSTDAAFDWEMRDLCELPLGPDEQFAAFRGLPRPGIASAFAPPTLIIGMYPVAPSFLLAETTLMLIQEYTGYKNLQLQLTGMERAHTDLRSGAIHLLMDFRPLSSFSSPTDVSAFLGDYSIIPLGALGSLSRQGLYISAVLAARIRQQLVRNSAGNATAQSALANLDLTATSWGALASLFTTWNLDPYLIPAAVGGEVLVLADDPALGTDAQLWGASSSRLCASPKGLVLGDGASPTPSLSSLPSYVLKPFYTLGMVIGCRFVTGGEDSLRDAMAAKVAAQGGRPDLMVVIPSEPSDLVLDGRYSLQRLPLPHYAQGCYAAGSCDWPRDVLQKVAWAGVRQFFPLDLWKGLQVRGLPQSFRSVYLPLTERVLSLFANDLHAGVVAARTTTLLLLLLLARAGMSADPCSRTPRHR